MHPRHPEDLGLTAIGGARTRQLAHSRPCKPLCIDKQVRLLEICSVDPTPGDRANVCWGASNAGFCPLLHLIFHRDGHPPGHCQSTF
jgi:hypothetical protein